MPRSERAPLGQRLLSEALATGFLLAAIVGSGIMAERLSDGNAALALLANSIATGAALIALILTFGPRSGAHMNPVVTLAAVRAGAMPWSEAPAYIAAQCGGAVAGVWVTHAMFGLPVFEVGQHARTGWGQWVAEIVATFGLLTVIRGCRAHPATATSIAVASYITAAYWFTSSTSFANPAVTLARALTDSFAGIKPADAPAFIVAQLIGAALATLRSSPGEVV